MYNFVEVMEKVGEKVVFMLAIILSALASCKNETGGKFFDHFSNEKIVDLSDLLAIYDKYDKANCENESFDLTAELLDERIDINEGFLVVSDTAFAIQLPQYIGSEHPFLATAEMFYNACQVGFNVWSNHELWLRECDTYELVAKKEVVEGILAIDEHCIRDKEICNAAKEYKTQILRMMMRTTDEWGEDESSMDLLFEYGEKIEVKIYKYFEDENQFVDSLNAMTKELTDATKHTFELYLKCDSAKRVAFILNALHNCRDFDEQCSLFLNWADCKEAEIENEWVIAVAERLMKSGRYNPCLSNIWMIWRCLFQVQYCGISRDSAIPNDMYNDMRKQCYLTCLKRIEKSPDDVFAMNCAAAIGGRTNMNRFGQFLFGNDAPAELHNHLSGRFGDDEENDE